LILKHESFQPPSSPDVSIWRYMDLTKFLWMLQKKALYFARSDLLGDPYEGHYTEAASASAGSAQTITRPMKMSTFVSCWHMNDDESAAMWKLYTSHQQSVCLRSKYSLLAELLPESCFAGCVKHIDYRTAAISFQNGLNFINYKRRSYEHEKELRAVVWDLQNAFSNKPETAKVVPIDLGKLITQVLLCEPRLR
jgi:hypothetical protein